MIEIIGKYNKADVFVNELDPATFKQILAMCNSKFLKDAVLKIMPDCHVGAGCTIGTTILFYKHTVINPLHVGVDIGCGVKVSMLKNVEIDFSQLDLMIRKNIPFGFAVHNQATETAMDLIDLLNCKKKLKNVDRLASSLGTLGSGNHFIELAADSKGDKYLLVHSGSRNLGLQVANYYSSIANNEGVLNDADTQDYLLDMVTCQEFAKVNRNEMASAILSEFKIENCEDFHTVHNYIEEEGSHFVLRKGAISSKAGEKLVIPINMKDGSLLAIGKGNKDWNYSAPHGAGRILSRSQAKKTLDMKEFEREMTGIYSTCVNKNTLDESPMAYKNIDDILEHIGETIDIIDRLKTLYNFKG